MSAVYCETHDMVAAAGQACPACAGAQLHERLRDLTAENLDLRRRVSALEHRVSDLQRAHNLVAADLGHLSVVACGECGFRAESRVAATSPRCPNCGAPATAEILS